MYNFRAYMKFFYLKNWMHSVLDIQATGVGDYETTEPTENLVIDIVVNAIKIGMHLSKQPKVVCKYMHMIRRQRFKSLH